MAAYLRDSLTHNIDLYASKKKELTHVLSVIISLID